MEISRRRWEGTDSNRGGWKTGDPRPCITSTPKSARKVKKTPKTPKYERDSCIPEAIFAERPYLATSVAGFSGLFFHLFSADSPPYCHTIPPRNLYFVYNYIFIIIIDVKQPSTR